MTLMRIVRFVTLYIMSLFYRSWICAENGWRHQSVPKDILAEADALGKSAINEDSDDDA